VGLNKSGRLQCLSDFIAKHKLDFVGIEETKKAEFSSGFLNSAYSSMDWKYIPAQGTTGGILFGSRSATMSVVRWKEYKYCATVIVKNCHDNFVWRLVIVYGSPCEESKMEFIEELQEMMES
jgi:hypothetical protein